jgi:hypothetical protein
MTFRARALLLALLLVAPARAEGPTSDLDPGIQRDELPEGWHPTGPLAVFAALEEAWAEGEAEILVSLLDPEEKVGLSFSTGGPRGGWFNRDQAYFLLKDLLEFSRTERFAFEKYWNLESNGRSPYAVAVHEFRMNDGATHTDQVYISLRRRDDTWYVGEIRSLDR